MTVHRTDMNITKLTNTKKKEKKTNKKKQTKTN